MEKQTNKSQSAYEEAWAKVRAMKQHKAEIVAEIEKKLKKEYERTGRTFHGIEVW